MTCEVDCMDEVEMRSPREDQRHLRLLMRSRLLGDGHADGRDVVHEQAHALQGRYGHKHLVR